MKLSLAFLALTAAETGTCRLSSTEYGGVNPSKRSVEGVTSLKCKSLAQEDYRENQSGSVQSQWQGSLKNARELNAFGRTGIRCLVKPVVCDNMPTARSNGAPFGNGDVVANDRSKGWVSYALNAKDCKYTVNKIAQECGNADAVVLGRPEAGSLCAHNRHRHANGIGWCQGDQESVVAKQPWEAGYEGSTQSTHLNDVVASQFVPKDRTEECRGSGNQKDNKMHHVSTGSATVRNDGDFCKGAGCAAYKVGEQVCKHFTCKSTNGHTTVAGFLNSNEKYHCENTDSGCVCKCKDDKECSLTHKSVTSKGHCKTKPTADKMDNCKITFAKGCPDEYSENHCSDEFRNHVERQGSKSQCMARAVELRRKCFKNPTSVKGYGTVTAKWTGSGKGTQTTDCPEGAQANLCAIKFSGADANSCPAQKALYGAGNHAFWMYSNHVEEKYSGMKHTKTTCLARATELRKACYQTAADGEGKVTAQWFPKCVKATAQTSDKWTNVCSIALDSCPDVEGKVPEGLKTHVTKESVLVQIKAKQGANTPFHDTATGTNALQREYVNGGNPSTFIDEDKLLNRLGRDVSKEWDVKETVTQVTAKTCAAQADIVHSQCFRTTEGKVTATWLPTGTESIVSTSEPAVDYWKKSPQALAGQTGCRIDFDVRSGNKCPRAQAENKAIAWDQKDHTEWTHSSAKACKNRATELYNYCFFWPGQDDELNQNINDDNSNYANFRTDMYYAGKVTATWGKNGDSESVCTGKDCATYQRAVEYFADRSHSNGKSFNVHHDHDDEDHVMEKGLKDSGHYVQSTN